MSQNYLNYLASQIKLSLLNKTGFSLPLMTIKDFGKLLDLLSD